VRRVLAPLAALLAVAATPARGIPPPIPSEYGRVTLESFTGPAGVPPVGFDHWRHRARFTCRLCHVDVGFAMRAGATEVSAASNRDGYHCGACHDGKRSIRGKVVFPACDGSQRVEPGGTCARCHRRPDAVRARKEYDRFAQELPRDWAGLVDWEKAEAAGLVRPADFLEGVSIKRDVIRNRLEVTIASKASWMSSVLFSHPKHAVWNGCEVCHPDIFPNAGGQERRYSMLSIYAGEACGACHDKVAFPLAGCERCHVKPVR
jgi:c(7)-type cytochrome triheme protein